MKKLDFLAVSEESIKSKSWFLDVFGQVYMNISTLGFSCMNTFFRRYLEPYRAMKNHHDMENQPGTSISNVLEFAQYISGQC